MCDNPQMWTLGNTRSLLAGPIIVGFGTASMLSCATQQDTAQALAIAGTAAVIIGASMAADNGECYAEAGGGAAYCSPGLSKTARRAGTATAVAGAGVAAAGYALQAKGPDVNRHAHTAPTGPTSPYRLIRKAPPEPEAGAATQAETESQVTGGLTGASGSAPDPASEKTPSTVAPPSDAATSGTKKCSAADVASGVCSEPKR
jgi:hypothetical protein